VPKQKTTSNLHSQPTFTVGSNSQLSTPFETARSVPLLGKIVYTVIARLTMLTCHTKSHECLHACEGALLVVDASQGIEEAPKLANIHLALVNKFGDCPPFEQNRLACCGFISCSSRNRRHHGLSCSDIVRASAKAGRGINDVRENYDSL
jgi:hypothetical protein